METKTPIQYSKSVLTKLLKKFFGTSFGKKMAFYLKIRGFNRVFVQHIREGKVIGTTVSYNDRVDKGADLQGSLMSGQSLNSITSPLPPVYVAVSSSTLTPAKGDTTLTGELSGDGLDRAIGTVQNYIAPTVLDGAASYDVYKQFTYSGAGATARSAALFDASSSGNMFVEDNFAADATLASGDLLEITWSVNI